MPDPVPTPTKSIAERIVTAFKTRMANIQAGAIYWTNLGDNVLLGPGDDEGPLPRLVIHAPDEAGDEQPNLRTVNELAIHFEGWAPLGHTGESTDAEVGLLVQRMVADIKRCAASPDRTLKTEDGSNLLKKLSYEGFMVPGPPKGSGAISVHVGFKVTYFERAGDPGALL